MRRSLIYGFLIGVAIALSSAEIREQLLDGGRDTLLAVFVAVFAGVLCVVIIRGLERVLRTFGKRSGGGAPIGGNEFATAEGEARQRQAKPVVFALPRPATKISAWRPEVAARAVQRKRPPGPRNEETERVGVSLCGENYKAELLNPSTCSAVVFLTSFRGDWSAESPDAFDYSGYPQRTQQNALFIRDRTNTWYHHGVTDFGDNLETTAANIAAWLAQYGMEPRAAVGASMGGYGSLVLGSLIRAKFSLAVVPQTSIKQEDAQRIGDIRFPTEYERAQRTTTTPHLLASADAIRRSPGGLRVVVHTTDDRLDLLQAAELVGLEDVVFMRVPESDHNLGAYYVVKTGLLDFMLAGDMIDLAQDREQWMAFVAARDSVVKLHRGELFG
ncbi:MAG TPA: hypothetical protein VKI44_31830 [Acetobacteraceae bacterium]|nr:hypothetical protein [Acetobacteraceae bacterium]